MAVAKVQFSIGTLSFSGEAEEGWLSDQMDKILAAAPTLEKAHAVPAAAHVGGKPAAAAPSGAGDAAVTLARHLKDKSADGKQVRRFLATADWLRVKGETILTPTGVAKALADNHQARLGNPADCLIKDVSKGLCEKSGSGNGFFITPDGMKDLGYTE